MTRFKQTAKVKKILAFIDQLIEFQNSQSKNETLNEYILIDSKDYEELLDAWLTISKDNVLSIPYRDRSLVAAR